MTTRALTAAGSKLTKALDGIDMLLASRSDPQDRVIRVLRERIAAACATAKTGSGLLDELDLLDTINELRADWYTHVEDSEQMKTPAEGHARNVIFNDLVEATFPLKDVRDSYPAFNPR